VFNITKLIEWDMGHRIPNHKNKCRNPHGHRYKMELTLSATLNTESGSSSEGMVVDFDDVKEHINKTIYEKLDHAFMVSRDDNIMTDFFKRNHNESFKVVYVPFIPTVENICRWCYEELTNCFPENIEIIKIRVYETPTSWADYIPDK